MKKYLNIVLFLVVGVLFVGCSKDSTVSGSPYPAAAPAPISFLDIDPSPTSAYNNENVTFYVRGLSKLDTSDYRFLVNQEPVTVVSVVDSSVTIKLPSTVGSGAASVVYNGVSYYGPNIVINGKISLFQKFGVGTGLTSISSLTIYDISLVTTGDNTSGYIITGNFKDFNGSATVAAPISGIAQISTTGNRVAASSFSAIGISSGYIKSLTPIKGNSGNYIVSGVFSNYDSSINVSNITKIDINGHISTQLVDLVNVDPINYPEHDTATVPLFNGGVSGGKSAGVVKMFQDNSGKFVAIGNFASFDSFYYYRSTYDNFIGVSTNYNQFARMDENGSLDVSYNIDPLTGLSYAGTNGFINDAIQLSNGKIVIVGSFSSFNNYSTGRIAMLADNGTSDPSFNPSGSGADGEITKVTYNATTKKILICGSFTKYNGVTAKGVALLNEDGSLDQSFSLGDIEGGIVTYAVQLTNNYILLTGTFDSYNSIYKEGMVFVDSKGTFAQGYNNLGAFKGRIHKVLETTDSQKRFSIVLVGSFNTIDGKQVGNIAQLSFEK